MQADYLSLKTSGIVLFAVMALTSLNSGAANISQCKDEQGNISFQSSCPPGTETISKKNYGKKEEPEKPVPVVFLISQCQACTAVIRLLTSNNIEFVEKNIEDNVELQAELMNLHGSLKVPTISIGDKILTDYDEVRLRETLRAEGYTGI